MILKPIGNMALKVARVKAKFSQIELAYATLQLDPEKKDGSISQTDIGLYERGYKHPTIHQANLISRVLGVKAKEIFPESVKFKQKLKEHIKEMRRSK